MPAKTGQARLVGFFPGLGSRSAYQDLTDSPLNSGSAEVAALAREAAAALGLSDPRKLLLVPENLPERGLARQGFLGAAFLAHNLALEAQLRAAAEERGGPLSFLAYTGESFGALAAAVAGGALSVRDGVLIAHAFTPLMLVAAEGGAHDDPLANELRRFLPDAVRAEPLVPEPYHVVGLRAEPDDLSAVLHEVAKAFSEADVEVHKLYSPRQTNVYVRAGARAEFEAFLRNFPAVRAEELKPPTTFLAHSRRLRAARPALERFLDEHGVVFRDPHTPVVSNSGAGLLTTAAQVRDAVLALTDEVMASRTTVETVESLQPDAILELGLGHKSLDLLADNGIETPALAYTGAAAEADVLLRTVSLTGELLDGLRQLYAPGRRVEPRHHETLRTLVGLAAESAFTEQYVRRTLTRTIADEMLRPERGAAPAFYQFLETCQHTWNFQDRIDAAKGELVLRARLKKRLTGGPDQVGRAYTELEVLDATGTVSVRDTTDTTRPEVVVCHFDGLPGLSGDELARRARPMLDSQPLAAEIADELVRHGADPAEPALCRLGYQYTLFHLLHLHRPALFAQSDYYLAGADPLGWLVALAAAGAVPLEEIVEPYALCLRGAAREVVESAVDRMILSLTSAELPVVSPDGVPLRSRKDLEAATRAVFAGKALTEPVRRLHLNGNCEVLSLGSPLDPGDVDTGGYETAAVSIVDPEEIWQRRLNPALDAFEDRCVFTLTDENERVVRYAQSRRLLSSTVHAYVEAGERITGFGKGGSESMTIFLERDGGDGVTVRKILSEALTTARWNPDGKGVMLPPFAKARKQAEYLQALPEPVRRYFPEVHRVVEREIPAASGGTAREVICEMAYVTGAEVSRFVERHSPPPAVIARLYEQIFQVLHRNVHPVNRAPAPGGTLEESYFRKIEDRLALCRRTAPATFSPELLDTERILIDGVSYLNHGALLRRFREHPEYREVLEPRYHGLVMGDTNTENIKIGDVEPLLRAQRLIEANAPREAVDRALADITADSLGIKFLDPRAIGYATDGAATRDDAMYDNKPWHNSLGHYDEIHFEQFRLRVDTGPGRTPSVDVEFLPGNAYQKAYRVRDVTARGGRVDHADPQGMEDFFAPVMTAVYGLDDPDSPYLRDDPYWLVRFVFLMGTHFTAMPPYHFQAELDGTLTDTYQTQRRPVAIYCEGIKWLNWALEMLEGRRTEFLGLAVPALPHLAGQSRRDLDDEGSFSLVGA
ncbi:ACP S-malonyltransferase [Amycolatopsis bartoniae]|nr:ACP S-malonyltransferase [Amycolatopsis bartoniae]